MNAGNVFPATAGKRSRHASRHVRDARAVMHDGIANQWFPLKSVAGENVPGIPGACATRKFAYLERGPWIIIWTYCTKRNKQCMDSVDDSRSVLDISTKTEIDMLRLHSTFEKKINKLLWQFLVYTSSIVVAQIIPQGLSWRHLNSTAQEPSRNYKDTMKYSRWLVYTVVAFTHNSCCCCCCCCCGCCCCCCCCCL